MRHLTLIVKPTHACPARCIYCSAHHGDREAGPPAVMSRDTLRALMARLEEHALGGHLQSVLFTWHGGEPLLVENSFYEEALTLQREQLTALGVQVGNVMQSNLLPLDGEKALMLDRLLRYHDGSRSKVGTSFDPLPGIRLLPGDDYARRWWDSVAILQRHGLEFGLVYTVHRRSLAETESIFRFFSQRLPGISVRFNPMYAEGRAAHSSMASFHVSPEEWGRFLIGFHRLWEESGSKEHYSPFVEYDQFHREGNFQLSCESSGRCTVSHLGVDARGDVYCCGRGIEEGSLRYGSVHRHPLTEILGAARRLAMENRRALLEISSCRDCPWWQYCHGGCPVDSLLTHGDLTHPTNWCLGRLLYFRTVFGTPRPSPTAATVSTGVYA